MKSEKNIQRKIINDLKSKGCIVIKIIRANIRGVPDLLAIYPNGEVCFIEIKTSKNKLTALQERFIGMLKKYNVKTYVYDEKGQRNY